MKVAVKIPIVVESCGRWHAMETYDGDPSLDQAMRDAQECASNASGHSNAARIVIVETTIELPAAPSIAVVQGTVTP